MDPPFLPPFLPVSLATTRTRRSGHRCVLKACTIEDNCLVGMGSVLSAGSYMVSIAPTLSLARSHADPTSSPARRSPTPSLALARCCSPGSAFSLARYAGHRAHRHCLPHPLTVAGDWCVVAVVVGRSGWATRPSISGTSQKMSGHSSPSLLLITVYVAWTFFWFG